jgi:uncharacterized protein YecE (DUF72 family)
MKLWIGTSGFQYPEWKGKFYPDEMPASKMLPYYAERFKSTEVNYTFRRIPEAKTILNWSAWTPEQFRFSFKAPQRITHFARLRGCAEVLGVFAKAIAVAEAKLGPVLFQLPPNFVKNVEVLEAFLTELPKGIQAVFEFRHESWFDKTVFEALRGANAALCIAENEEFATPLEATADFGYLRLRREDYTSAKIKKWTTSIMKQKSSWSEAFVYFKHEQRGVGPEFAQQMQAHFGSAG